MKVKLNENTLRKIIRESITNVLMEGVYTPNGTPRQMQTQVAGTQLMSKSVENGNNAKAIEAYVGSLPKFYNAITKLAMENNTTYPDILKNLNQKIQYYLQQGYFGEQQNVITTIQKFSNLLVFLNGNYESAINRVLSSQQRQVSEGAISNWYNNLRYKDQNRYGVNQKIQDNSGNQYAVNTRNGQWMKDLQGELQKLLGWNMLHGKQTVEATNAFIEFLEVEKKSLLGGMFNWQLPIKKMSIALAGLVLLSGTLSYCGNGQGQNQNDGNNQPQTTMTQQQNKIEPAQIDFSVNSFDTSNMKQQLQQFANYRGDLNITVHESQNSIGRDARNEDHLVAQRAQAIQNTLRQMGYKGNIHITRGENSQRPFAEVTPANYTPQWMMYNN